MSPLKFGLLYVDLAMLTATGDALLRALGRRPTRATWVAAACLGYGAAVLLAGPRLLWWPAVVAGVAVAVPVAGGVLALRDGVRRRDISLPVRPLRRAVRRP